ncbi:hypothetical protein E2C01_011960 [Portunus trituberculatus]|uniref:Uncharacterized protein n=1 Tax=Portunus trituberculatus TaxID=210409 RepID=A0A5B7DCR1_PORTR|nr:hypothetical protein [Portunus trituberculatus]
MEDEKNSKEDSNKTTVRCVPATGLLVCAAVRWQDLTRRHEDNEWVTARKIDSNQAKIQDNTENPATEPKRTPDLPALPRDPVTPAVSVARVGESVSAGSNSAPDGHNTAGAWGSDCRGDKQSRTQGLSLRKIPQSF